MRPVDFELFYYNDTELRSVASHHHDYCEFYFFLEGNVKYHIGNAIYKLSYGDCLLIPPGRNMKNWQVTTVHWMKAETSLTNITANFTSSAC